MEKKSAYYYAVAKGRNPGIYGSWEECKAQTDGYTGAVYKKFQTCKQAEDFVASSRFRDGCYTESFTCDDEGHVIVFTGGACRKNGRIGAKAGIGVWFGENHKLNVFEAVLHRPTNNSAEIQAAMKAIESAKENDIRKLHIKTDSKYTIDCVTKWVPTWLKNNWTLSSGGAVKNKDDLIKLNESMKEIDVKWTYVPGHEGIIGNEEAHKLAVLGAAV